MARTKGLISVSANFEVKAAAPIDARAKVPTRADLVDITTWVIDGANFTYLGMPTVVTSDPVNTNNGLYLLLGNGDYSNASNWIKVGANVEGQIIYLGIYNPLTTYKKGELAKASNGNVYHSNIDGNNTDPAVEENQVANWTIFIEKGEEGEQGLTGIVYKGDYVESIEGVPVVYNSRDVVRCVVEGPNFGNNYYCRVDGTSSKEPSVNPTEWALFVLRGAPGPQGIPGPAGYTPVKGVDYFDGSPGLNNYELYLATTTDDPKMSMEEWWESMRGPEGGSSLIKNPIPIYMGNLPDGSPKTLGKYVSGQTITPPPEGWTAEQLIRDIAMESVPPTSTLQISGSIPFNSTLVEVTITFNHVIKTPGATLKTKKLEVKRGSSGSWEELNITGITTFPGNYAYSSSVISGSNNSDTLYARYTITDSNDQQSISTAEVTPLGYSIPTIASKVTDTKEMGDIAYTRNNISVTKNTANSTLISHQFLVKIGNNTTIPIGSPVNFSTTPTPSLSILNAGSVNNVTITAGATINGVSVVTSLVDAAQLRVYVRVVDSITTTDIEIFNRTLEYKKFYGTRATDISVASDYRTLTVANNSSTTHSWLANGNYHIVAVPSNKAMLTAVNVDSSRENIFPQFVLTSVNIPDAGGNLRSYKVYKLYTSVSFGVTIEVTTN